MFKRTEEYRRESAEKRYDGNGASHSIENQGDKPLEFLGIILTYQPPER